MTYGQCKLEDGDVDVCLSLSKAGRCGHCRAGQQSTGSEGGELHVEEMCLDKYRKRSW